MKKGLILFLLFLPWSIMAQGWSAKPIAISVFNNATMLPPASLTATFNQPLHPGFALSYEFGWKDKGRHKWFQNATIGYMYHRYAFQSVLLYTQPGYRHYFGKFSAEGSLNAGYMHSFFLTERAVQQDDGTYKASQGFGKPQFIAGAGIGLGYNFGSTEKIRRIFINYDIRLQMPFVSGYTPLLPNGSLSLGMQFTLNRTDQK
jgi:hypothetical protein